MFVLLPFLVSLVLVAVGLVVVAKIAQLAMRRLRLELDSVLLWLGIAEAPIDDLTALRLH